MKYGYVRVSTKIQNEERQIIQLLRQGILMKNIFIDKISGKDFNRPQYKKMIKKLKKGDVIYIPSIDRLGRNYEEIIYQWKVITKDIGADICILDMPLLDTRNCKDLLGTFIADLVLQILSYAAENERNSIKERQKAGIENALAKGVKFGRPTKELPKDFEKIVQAWRNNEITLDFILDELGMSQSTFYRKSKPYRNR